MLIYGKMYRKNLKILFFSRCRTDGQISMDSPVHHYLYKPQPFVDHDLYYSMVKFGHTSFAYECFRRTSSHEE